MNSVSFITILILLNFHDACTYKHNVNRRGLTNPIKLETTRGQPWPLPQSIRTTAEQFSLNPILFRFQINETSQSCDTLTGAIDRYYQIIFYPDKYLPNVIGFPQGIRRKINSNRNYTRIQTQNTLEKLYINVQEPCDRFPSLESNESCMLHFYTLKILLKVDFSICRCIECSSGWSHS